MIGKKYYIVYLYTQTSQIDCFRPVYKWSSGFKAVHVLSHCSYHLPLDNGIVIII